MLFCSSLLAQTPVTLELPAAQNFSAVQSTAVPESLLFDFENGIPEGARSVIYGPTNAPNKWDSTSYKASSGRLSLWCASPNDPRSQDYTHLMNTSDPPALPGNPLTRRKSDLLEHHRPHLVLDELQPVGDDADGIAVGILLPRPPLHPVETVEEPGKPRPQHDEP